MKYDLIVVGGGPGGLMAAKTAAEDGLKVLLVERRRRITQINRACTQIFYLRKLTPVGTAETGQRKKDGYLEPVSVDIESEKAKLNFHGPGFSVDFTGNLRPYLNWIQVSPSGHIIHRYPVNEGVWGFFLQKEALAADLLTAAQNAGVEILEETIGLGAENTSEGVMVTVGTKSGEKTFQAKAAIAADGKRSKIVESVGLNKQREKFAPRGRKFVHFVMEGVEDDFPDSSFVSFTIPSINPFANMILSIGANDTRVLGCMTVGNVPAPALIDRFIKHSKFAPWFRNATIVKGEATMGRRLGALTPVKRPVAGNVVVVGDAGAPSETWVQGALACGFQAVKAIEKELDGRRGYEDYIQWWQRSFAFNTPEYLELNKGLYPLNRVSTDEDIDFIYKRFGDRIGIPQLIVPNNMDIIKKERPSLHDKLIQSKAKK